MKSASNSKERQLRASLRAEKPFDLRFKGLRIPFVAAWEGEESQTTIEHDPTVNMAATFTGRIDHRQAASSGQLGKPLLGVMAPQRQRYVVAKDLCQVCGRALVSKIVLGYAKFHGPDKTLAIDEPACCPACAIEAVSLCPFAKKAFAEKGAMLVDDLEKAIQLVVYFKSDWEKVRDSQRIPRAVFRRYLGQKLANHVRIIPKGTALGLVGEEGLKRLEELAESDDTVRRSPGKAGAPLLAALLGATMIGGGNRG